MSHAWSPDGRHLALSLDEIGGNSGYVGLHVIDTATGRDRQIPSGPPADPRDPRFRAYFQRLNSRLGCWPPSQLAWSADGTKLAYPCGTGAAQTPGGNFISILEINGAGHTAIRTPTGASWPSWSADGKRIVYATAIRLKDHPALYTVRVDGTHRMLLAKGGTAPAWSPNGHTIAYQTGCGIRLMTPAGTDITPHTTNGCGAIGQSGAPVWSPDGTEIAFETEHGIYTMNRNGTQLHLVSHKATSTWYGQLPGRPSWRPLP